MTEVGRIHKTYDMYVDQEEVAAAITKGELVNWYYQGGEGTIKKTATSLDQAPPYGVALETATADGDKILVAWRGVVKIKHDITNDDTLWKNECLAVSPSTAGCVEGWTTTLAEFLYVGHALEDCTSTTAEVMVMLAGW